MMYPTIKQAAKVVLYGIVAFVTLSCEDSTDNNYEQEPGKNSIYTDPSEALTAVTALYRTGAPTFYGESTPKEGPVAAIGGFLSGFFDNESKSEAKLCTYTQQLTFDADNIADYLIHIHQQSYDAIYKANIAIHNIPYTKDLTEEQKTRLVAESYFFRAFNYFYLVKYFGRVPLQKSPETEMVSKASIADIYKFIVNDLQLAACNLPDSAYTENSFRISKTTAETLLADVYLTMSGYPLKQDCYKKAADMAKSVINNGKHSLVSHGGTQETSAYNILRTVNANPECIYSYRTGQSEAENSLMELSLPKEATRWNSVKIKTTNNAYQPIRQFLNVYDSVYDIRMHEQQFFHTFYKYEKKGITMIETFPQISYWWFDKEALETGITQRDIIIYRYAEVLLIAAEAIAQSEGITNEAVRYLADVRTRAYFPANKEEIISQLSALSKEEFVKEVWLERMREFPFEMKIWSDIQRTRKYPVTSAKSKGTANFVDVIGATNPWGAVYAEKHLLLPLP